MAYAFNGVDQWVEYTIPGASAEANKFRTDEDWTYFGWFNRDTVVGQVDYAGQWGDPTNQRFFSYNINDDDWRPRWKNQTAVTHFNVIKAGTWQFLVSIHDATSANDLRNIIFDEGSLTPLIDVTTTYTFGYPGTTTVIPMQWGRRVTGNFFNGSIANAGYIQAALSLDEVRQVMLDPEAALAYWANDVLLWYSMSATTDTGLMLDYGADECHGTINGTPTKVANPAMSYHDGRIIYPGAVTPPVPPTFVAAWAKQSTIGAGFEAAA